MTDQQTTPSRAATRPYADRLRDAVEACGNPIVVGLDPHLDRLPEPFGAIARDASQPRAARARAIGDFLVEVVAIAEGRVPAVKPQAAFFELFGADGVRELERVTEAAHDAGLLVIGDVKRGDIGSTARAYAGAALTGLDGSADPGALFDAATVNPYLGEDSIQPFLDACDASGGGLYVLVRTSNPSSADLQTLEIDGRGGDRVCDVVADHVARWGEARTGESGWSSIGAVVGATHPDELARLRERMPRTPLLLPGYGAQGASAADVRGAFSDGPHGALVNSSRGILFADAGAGRWQDATRDAISRMADDLAGALGA